MKLEEVSGFRVQEEVEVGVPLIHCSEAVTPFHLVAQLLRGGYGDLCGNELVVHPLSVDVDADLVLVPLFP